MFRVSRRVDYAVKVMVAVAQVPYGDYIAAPTIGEHMNIPQSFLMKVIGDLRRSGLVVTAVGRSGGVSLARPPETITVLDVVEAIEGPIVLNSCEHRPGECPRDETCPAHSSWEALQQTIRAELHSIGLLTLAHQTYPPGE